MVVRLDAPKSQRLTSSPQACCRYPAVALPIRKITGATPHGYVEEHLTPFGGIFPLEKLYDALEIESAFAEHFIAPKRTPEIGHWRIVKGIVNSQFLGRQRLYI